VDKKSNIFWGVVLIVVGFLFLGTNLDWFQLDWSFRQIARFWPVMLILAGAAAFFNHKKSVYNATSALLIAFAIPLGIYTCVDDGVRDFKDEVSDGLNIDIDDFDDDDDHDDDNDSYSKKDTVSGDRNKQYFAVELTPEVKEATLNLKGGVAEFDLEESNNRLFEATTLLQYKGGYTLEEEKTSTGKTIDFSMKDKNDKGINFDLDGENNDNDVLVKLSTAPIWTIDMGIGAGEVDFDFSNYKVKKVNLETGVASIDLKLGDKQDNVDVKVKSGVASGKISVPESVGCEIRMDGALNAKDFDDFEKIKDGVWQTKGYDKATKKIKLDVDSGLSSLKVNRY
jgi:Domain of unknown function (DUF5668)